MNKVNDGGPAFPQPDCLDFPYNDPNRGMSLRDYFAAEAMAHIVVRPFIDIQGKKVEIEWGGMEEDVIASICERSAVIAYQIADAMLLVRDGRLPGDEQSQPKDQSP